MKETTTWAWAFGVIRQDGTRIFADPDGKSLYEHDARQMAGRLDMAAREIGLSKRAEIVKRKRTVKVIVTYGPWVAGDRST